MGSLGIRTAVMCSLEGWTIVDRIAKGPAKQLASLGAILRYAMQVQSRRKRIPMNVEELVNKWIEAVVGMSTAHDKDTYDSYDRAADELLGPILTSPVKQIREFYFKLLERLKAEPRVPMLVWMSFEAWGEVMVKDAPDEKVIRLKNKLAQDIAELVEEGIRDQIPNAVARALRWRDPETLEAVKEALKSTKTKPKLVGRQSCLFLEVKPRKGKKVSVML